MARKALLVALLATHAVAEETLVDRWDKPKRESFDMKGAWPEHVAEEIQKRYDVAFDLDAIDLKRADFVAQDVTVFEALDRFAALHGLHLAGVPPSDGNRTPWEKNLRLIRVAPAIARTPVAYVGPTRFSVESVSVVRVERCAPAPDIPVEIMNTIDNEDIPRLRLRLRWLAPPGFEEAQLVHWTCDEAVDDLKRPCAAIPMRFTPTVQANNRLVIELQPPRDGAKKLARVELSVRIALPVVREEIAFDASEVGTTRMLGGASITFTSLEGNEVLFDAKGPLNAESKSTRIFPALPGRRADANCATLHAYSESGAEIEIRPSLAFRRLSLQLAEPPRRLVLRGVTKVAVREATVVFTDVPLPR